MVGWLHYRGSTSPLLLQMMRWIDTPEAWAYPALRPSFSEGPSAPVDIKSHRIRLVFLFHHLPTRVHSLAQARPFISPFNPSISDTTPFNSLSQRPHNHFSSCTPTLPPTASLSSLPRSRALSILGTTSWSCRPRSLAQMLRSTMSRL